MPKKKTALTVRSLCQEAGRFAQVESSHAEPSLYGVTDGKAVGTYELAKEILQNPPKQGYLTISNALQWRLQYGRVIDKAGTVNGILRIR